MACLSKPAAECPLALAEAYRSAPVEACQLAKAEDYRLPLAVDSLSVRAEDYRLARAAVSTSDLVTILTGAMCRRGRYISRNFVASE